MQLHQLSPKHKKKQKKRVGRGGKRGTYSGRGQKGQRSRAGAKFKPIIRELIKKYPKLRGYRQSSKLKAQNSKLIILNLETLEKKFDSGVRITPEMLLDRGLIHKIKGKLPKVKILGEGELTKSLIIESCEVSKTAKKKIEEAGGEISSKSKV